MLSLSWRYLISRKKQSFLILLGVVLGTGAYVVISGMMLGFQDYIREKLIDNEPHITITSMDRAISPSDISKLHYKDQEVLWEVPPGGYRSSKNIENPPQWFHRISQVGEVKAWAPSLVGDALIRRSSFEQTIRIIGARPWEQVRITNIESYMVEGSFLNLSESGKKLIMGKALADKLGARRGDNVEIVMSSGKKESFKIAGLFELGVKPIDERTVFAGILDVQALKNSPGAIGQISVTLFDVNKAEALANEWKPLSNENVTTWIENNQSILSVFKTQDIVRNFMTISILVVASFGIYNILSILISQKRRDIAILRALGFYPSDIVKIFLWQGLLIGIAGGVLGMAIGNLVCQYLSTIDVAHGRMGGMGNKMLISFDYLIYLKAFLLAFVSSLFSSYLPARAAGKLKPMEIFRSS